MNTLFLQRTARFCILASCLLTLLAASPVLGLDNSIEYRFSASQNLNPAPSTSMAPAFKNNVWFVHEEISGGVAAIFRNSQDRSEDRIAVELPGILRIVVVSRSLNAHGLGLLNVRLFSVQRTHTNALILVDRKARSYKLLVTEPFVCQNPVIEDSGMIWSFGWTRTPENRVGPPDSPVMLQIDSSTGISRIQLRQNDLSLSQVGYQAEGSFGPAKTSIGPAFNATFVPSTNDLLIYDRQLSTLKRVSGPSFFQGKEIVPAVSVLSCAGRYTFVSARSSDGISSAGLWRFDHSDGKWSPVLVTGRPQKFLSPTLVSCPADESLEVVLSPNSIGTLSR